MVAATAAAAIPTAAMEAALKVAAKIEQTIQWQQHASESDMCNNQPTMAKGLK